MTDYNFDLVEERASNFSCKNNFFRRCTRVSVKDVVLDRDFLGAGSGGVVVRDVGIDHSEELVSKAGLVSGAADWGVLLVVQEALDGAICIDLEDQSGGVWQSLRHINTLKSLGSDREEDVRAQGLVVGEGQRQVICVCLVLDGDVDLGVDVLEELRGDEVGSLIVGSDDGLSKLIVVVDRAEICGKPQVGGLSISGTSERNGIHVGPGEVVAQFHGGDVLLLHFCVEFGLGHAEFFVKSGINFFEKWSSEVFVGGAVLLVDGEEEIFLKACLLNREGLETEGQGESAELFLPLGEVGTLNGWDGVALLPFGEVVGVGRGVESHHLGL